MLQVSECSCSKGLELTSSRPSIGLDLAIQDLA